MQVKSLLQQMMQVHNSQPGKVHWQWMLHSPQLHLWFWMQNAHQLEEPMHGLHLKVHQHPQVTKLVLMLLSLHLMTWPRKYTHYHNGDSLLLQILLPPMPLHSAPRVILITLVCFTANQLRNSGMTLKLRTTHSPLLIMEDKLFLMLLLGQMLLMMSPTMI